MTQEEKELLVKDLCARLPYGVKIALNNNGSYHHENVAKTGDITIDKLKGFNGSYFSIYHDNPLDWDWYDNDIDIKDIKPYLFPLSSMTEEQKYDFYCRFIENDCDFDDFKKFYLDNGMWHKLLTSLDDIEAIIDWFNKNHFDYRGLIEKGLAIDATGKNIY